VGRHPHHLVSRFFLFIFYFFMSSRCAGIRIKLSSALPLFYFIFNFCMSSRCAGIRIKLSSALRPTPQVHCSRFRIVFRVAYYFFLFISFT
jgi:hypothetical protein